MLIFLDAFIEIKWMFVLIFSWKTAICKKVYKSLKPKCTVLSNNSPCVRLKNVILAWLAGWHTGDSC